MKGILGKKIGMTQLYDENGVLTPVTLIEAGPCTILQVKDEKKDGYAAIKLGFDDKKEKCSSRPELGNFKKANCGPKRFVRELRMKAPEDLKVGQEIKADIFQEGEYVDVGGVSKGKGFQGGMKRWHWRAGKSGHGSMHHRQPGSIGASSFPSKVDRGHHLPGHMGGANVTIQNLKIVKVDKDNNLIVVSGTIPGHNNSYLTLRSAKKKSSAGLKDSK